MDYDTWMQLTKRGLLTPRSSSLKKMDALIEACYPGAKSQKKAGGTKDRVDLANSLEAWMKTKADWRNSVRNQPDKNGKGAVELLIEQLGKDPTIGAKFRAYLNAPAPSSKPLGRGVVKIQKDIDGKFFEIKIQSKENSCGPASIRIVSKLVNNVDIGEDYLRQAIEMAEEGGAYTGGLGGGGVVKSSGVHNWEPNGYGTWLVPAVLAGLRPAITAKHSDSTSPLIHASRSKPVIAVVEWDGGGLHYVVLCGKYTSDGNKMRVLDPYYGLQSVSISGGQLGKYKPVHPDTGSACGEADWYAWACRVV